MRAWRKNLLTRKMKTIFFFFFFFLVVLTNTWYGSFMQATQAAHKRYNFMFHLRLRTFTTDPARKLNVFGHDGNTLGMNGAEISVFKQTDNIRLRCFLQGHNSAPLEPQIAFEFLGNLSY